MLIVGAGNGNDVALALSQDVGHIDAVEIDPVIQAAGRDLHPAHPYQDPRVSPHIDDGRAFLERTDQTYDLILFALPDSLTLVSGQGSLRLESYLFTREAMETVRDHLNPGGAFAMYNYYRDDVFERYANTMSAGVRSRPVLRRRRPDARPPRASGADRGQGSDRHRLRDDVPVGGRRARALRPTITRSRTCAAAPSPTFYLWWLGSILLASVVIVRLASGAPLGQMRPYVDLFFMGAAFLLLETKSVVQFALLFGTTWFVNSLVFAGILLAVLAAIEVARRAKLPPADRVVRRAAGLPRRGVVDPARVAPVAVHRAAVLRERRWWRSPPCSWRT